MNNKGRPKYIFSEKELPQKSQIWRDLRNCGIGASEISILRGTFPTIWCNDYELFLIKMDRAQNSTSEHIERGNELEDKARKYVEKYLKNDLNKPQNELNVYNRIENLSVFEPKFIQCTAKYKHFPQVFASFDGIDKKNKLVLEIKCPSEQTFTKILKNRVPTIPKTYFDQVQCQLLIANSLYGITEGIFALYYEDGVYLENKKTKEKQLIKLILIKTQLDLNHCDEMIGLCRKFCKVIDAKRWNKHWKD